MKTVLYFGNINMELSRNKVYSEGLRRNGIEVLTCTDRSPGLKKYWNLYKKHREYVGKYDAIIVGFGGYLTVPLAKLLSKKPVIFDALCSFYETEILSRDALHEIPFRKFFARSIDWLSTRFADMVLVETDNQKKYFNEVLKIKNTKLLTVYTGVDDSVFYVDESVEKFEKFTVLFRGRFMLEAGFKYIFEALKDLECEDVDFLLIGYGCGPALKDFKEGLKDGMPKNFKYIGDHVSFQELRELALKCHVSLGWFNDNERTKRTIPHKIFEAFSMRIPVITARAEGVEEVLVDGENCFLVEQRSSVSLKEKVRFVKDNAQLAKRVAENAYLDHKTRFTPQKIVKPIIDYIASKS